MGSIPDKDSSPTISLDEEIELDDVVPTALAERPVPEVRPTLRPQRSASGLAAASGSSSAPAAASGPASGPPERAEAGGRTANSIAELPVIGHYSRFALLGRIAFGGMAEIFLARESSATGASRHLVVKRILPHVADDEGFVTMFLDEARLAIRLQHPNICPIYEFGEAQGTWFIAMEWVNGVPLGKLIRKARATGGIPVPVTVRVLAQISEALHYAHRARDDQGQLLGIVHRDVSPQNIMVSYSGSVKLLDFGVAKANSHSAKTQAGVVKGKLAYMAPEQCRGEEIDARADVFALGVCLFEALTGRPLYHRATEFETLKAVMDDPVPSVRSFKPELPADLDAIVQHALAKLPDERWQSAGELQEALEQWLTDHREMMNAARTGQYLETLYGDEIARGPSITTTSISPGGGTGEHLPAASASAPNARAAGLDRMPHTPQPYTLPPTPSLVQALIETSPAERRSRPPVEPKSTLPLVLGGVAAALLVLALGGGLVAWVVLHRPEPIAPLPLPPPVVALVAAVVDAGAPVAVVVPDVPVVPVVPVLPVAPVEPPTIPGSDDPEAPSTPTTHEPSHPRVMGTLAINTRPWSKVYIGSRLLGTTPLGGISVPVGSIALRLVDRDGATHRRTVRVEAGQGATAFFDLTTE
jgi:serine/threonine-protein kinase